MQSKNSMKRLLPDDPDLEAKLTELENQRKALDESSRALRKSAALRAQQIIDAFGLTSEDIVLPNVAQSSEPKRKCPPKYRGPSGELWSGRGKIPKWLQRELANGAKIEAFEL